MNHLTAIGLASSITLITPAALAQTADSSTPQAATDARALPDGMELIRRHTRAIGGQAGLELEAVEFVGTFEIEAMGISGEIVITEAAPNSQLIVVSLGQFGEIVQGTNGTLAWGNTQPNSPPQLLSDEQTERAVRRSNFFERWDPEQAASSATTTGTEEIDGTTCYRVEIETPYGERSVQFFDVETGLKRRSVAMTDEGIARQTTTYSDYRTVGDVGFPYTLDIENSAMTQKITIDEITLNPDLPADRFAPPVEF